jgi:phosphate transport system protein
MPELQKRLDSLLMRLDRMGLRVQEAFETALRAVRSGDMQLGRQVNEGDIHIDREEVEIEQECISLLALYQPAAFDLRAICMVIKANNDLERIADKAAGIGRRTRHLVTNELNLRDYPSFDDLARSVQDMLARTIRLLNRYDESAARAVIEWDRRVDEQCNHFIKAVLENERRRSTNFDAALTLALLGRSLERVGDLCSNIAEDVIFLRTGDIVRHAGAFGE